MTHLTINLPGAIMPLERGERFEEPLMDAFDAEGIEGRFCGGGSSLGEVDGRRVVTSCDIELKVEDVALALPVIRRVLTEAGAPPGTTIRSDEPDVVYRLEDG